jgi:hypothetical protein
VISAYEAENAAKPIVPLINGYCYAQRSNGTASVRYGLNLNVRIKVQIMTKYGWYGLARDGRPFWGKDEIGQICSIYSIGYSIPITVHRITDSFPMNFPVVSLLLENFFYGERSDPHGEWIPASAG